MPNVQMTVRVPVWRRLPVTNLKTVRTCLLYHHLENLNRQTLTKEDWQRTVSISDGGIGPRIRRLRAAEVQALVENGRHATATFLKSAYAKL
jgi:NTE family protein